MSIGGISTPKIVTTAEKRLIGQRSIMSFAQNTTPLLWKSFMPRRHEVVNTLGADLYSVQLYNIGFFDRFDPAAGFEKWAALEVSRFDTIPEGMEFFILPAGLYAVFQYKGNPNNGAAVFGYILQQWLPQSGYKLDTRPHFEVLGAQYKNGSDDSEEEIWIPLRQ